MLSRLMTGREQLILVFVASAVLIGVISLFVDRTRADAPMTAPNASESVPPLSVSILEPPVILPEIPREPEPVEVAVSIQGAIVRPGLYRLEGEARVQDLIERAGGLADAADTSNINLAARLIDATTLTIPVGVVIRRDGQSTHFERRRRDLVWNPPQYTVRGWQPDAVGSVGSASGGARSTAVGLINVNTASQTELESLPGIGPKYAAAIIEYRRLTPFRSIEELQAVSGIGEKRLEAIRHLVRVQ